MIFTLFSQIKSPRAIAVEELWRIPMIGQFRNDQYFLNEIPKMPPFARPIFCELINVN